MAFRSNIDYVGHQRLRQSALGDVTKAKYTKKLKDEAEARRKAKRTQVRIVSQRK